MAEQNEIQLFDGKQVRYVWDEKQEKYFFSIVDVIQVLTDSENPRKYWSVLKTRLKQEGSELATDCSQLKMPSRDGKNYLTDVADTEHVFRLIQSIPSKKAEPFKLWFAALGQERMNQLQDPELSIEQAIKDYRRLGYSETWINQRIKTIEIRKGRLRKENLRDNMTNVELMLNGLAEAAATELSRRENPKGFVQNANIAQRGGDVAHVARERLEQELGDTVISDKRAINFTNPPEELPFNEVEEVKE